MPSGSATTRPPLLGGLSYFEYQQRVCTEVVTPWLSRRLDLEALRVADFGAHHGGMLEALRAAGVVASAVGFELRADVVEESPFVPDDRFRLVVADVTALAPESYEFDLVILHDVLEHIPGWLGVLSALAAQLAPGGRVLVTFPPYYSAFGGHQHLARSTARNAPFIHYLPRRVFLRLAAPAAQEYMSAESSLDDMLAVRATKLTLAKAERGFESAGLAVQERELFVFRPEHRLRYGVPLLGAGPFGWLPGVREIVVNGAHYLLKPGRAP